MKPPDDHAALARTLARWFLASARRLPWRDRPLTQRREAWRVLVSEVMLQQTQASRVADRFDAFLARFPTPGVMADADERGVLAAWSGLGYYRRARLLHAAARAIVDAHDGRVPGTVEALRALPGIGRYSAGAIASLAFHVRAPAVDANVRRVLLRIRGIDAAGREGDDAAWSEAERLVSRARRTPAGVINESLIELGATICTSRAPGCGECPVRERCRARAEGRQHDIPARAARPRRRDLYCDALVVRDRRGRVLVEERPARGMWGGLWQAPTLERVDRHTRPAELVRTLGVGAALPSGARARAAFTFDTTHRRCRFRVFHTRAGGAAPAGRRWATRAQLAALALATPQRRILLGARARA